MKETAPASVAPLPEALARALGAIHRAAAEKHAREPVALDVRALSSITDVLYVCHGESARAVEAIVDAILAGLAEAGIKRSHVEGRAGALWVLIDLGDIMVHVFVRERREYYTLERMWHDAPVIDLPA